MSWMEEWFEDELECTCSAPIPALLTPPLPPPGDEDREWRLDVELTSVGSVELFEQKKKKKNDKNLIIQ